jgi:hypothetical protein
MKRLVVFLILILAVATGILYFGISSTQSFSASVSVACTNEGALRVLSTAQKGWPGEKLNDSAYQFNQLRYTVSSTLINLTGLRFDFQEKNLHAELAIDEIMPDSSVFTITANTQLSNNPVKRMKEYVALSGLKKEITALLAALKNNFDGEEIVYGLKVEMGRVKDSIMISTRKLMNHYPTVDEVYGLIDGIRSYLQQKGGIETSAPMLNVFKEAPDQYLVMTAIPTKTIVEGNDMYLQKRMLPNGYILMSEVEGGPAVLQQAEEAMRQYVTDHQKSSPAIPFQMLLTDRRAEPDTSKWKTRLYYPVMY